MVMGGGGGERCCDKFQIFQISINVSPEPLKVVKTVNLVLLMWMDAKEDYVGENIFHWVIACRMGYVTKRKYSMSVSFANSVIWTS